MYRRSTHLVGILSPPIQQMCTANKCSSSVVVCVFDMLLFNLKKKQQRVIVNRTSGSMDRRNEIFYISVVPFFFLFFLSDWSHKWEYKKTVNEIMSYSREDSICDVRIFSFFFYSCIMFFCKYTEKNFMGFEYASIKLLFPDLRCRLHLFLRRLRTPTQPRCCCGLLSF